MIKIIFFLSTLYSLLFTSFVYAGEIAVIVNKENAIEEVSFKDLVKIFKQDRQYWESGKKIYLIIQEAGSPEKKIVLEKIYKMNDEGLKKFWLAKMYRGEISSFPKTLGSNESVKRFVSRVPNAVGFIDSDFLDDSVKILKIDGKFPKDKSYILTVELEAVRDED